MKIRHAVVLTALLALSSNVLAARPSDRDPAPPFFQRIIRIVRFIIQSHNDGIVPPHP